MVQQVNCLPVLHRKLQGEKQLRKVILTVTHARDTHTHTHTDRHTCITTHTHLLIKKKTSLKDKI